MPILLQGHGAGNRNRTCDLVLTKDVFYLLNYTSVGLARSLDSNLLLIQSLLKTWLLRWESNPRYPGHEPGLVPLQSTQH